MGYARPAGGGSDQCDCCTERCGGRGEMGASVFALLVVFVLVVVAVLGLLLRLVLLLAAAFLFLLLLVGERLAC